MSAQKDPIICDHSYPSHPACTLCQAAAEAVAATAIGSMSEGQQRIDRFLDLAQQKLGQAGQSNITPSKGQTLPGPEGNAQVFTPINQQYPPLFRQRRSGGL